MNDKTVSVDKKTPEPSNKLPYQTPHLQEQGDAKDVTLQTFFGTFSPPNSD